MQTDTVCQMAFTKYCEPGTQGPGAPTNAGVQPESGGRVGPGARRSRFAARTLTLLCLLLGFLLVLGGPEIVHAEEVVKPIVTVTKPTYLPYLGQFDSKPPLPLEVRALWISRFDLGSPPVKRARLEALIEHAAGAGFNVILLQVRATADAYYTPGLDPWSYRLTSSRVSDLGRDPGWDPLAVAIGLAHQRGLELHAYVNAFSVWECSRGAPPHTAPEHAYWHLAGYDPESLHYGPSWRVYALVNGQPTPMGDSSTDPVPCSEYLWGSPGVERVGAHTAAVLRDIATRYPLLDGIHLDRVRYPGRQYSHDPETLAAWHATAPPVAFEDWQRDRLSGWVARSAAEIKAVRPDITLSAAVWFTYKKTAAMTFPTSQGYADYYQDSHRWLADGSVDAIAPMIYGATFNGDFAKWKVLAEDHVRVQAERQVWLGIGGDMPEFDRIAERIAAARALGARGVAIWSAGAIDTRGYWDELRAGPFKDPARSR